MNLHLVSDSTGDTLLSITRATLAQFPSVEINQFSWFLIRSDAEFSDILLGIEHNPGIVLYTIMEQDFAGKLHALCNKLGVPCVPVLYKVFDAFQKYLNINMGHHQRNIEYQDQTNDGYMHRIDAINFTIAHDDGALLDDIDESDIILIGASRTSKTPTSIYLAYRGYKVTNIPFISLETFPDIIFKIKKPLIVGLVIDPLRLEAIRKTRMFSMETSEDNLYTDIDKIEKEIVDSRKLFARLGCPVINVTQRGVEETAVFILKYITQRNA